MYVAYLFGDFERAGEAAELMRRERRNISPAPWWTRAEWCFVEGLTAVALARKDVSRRKQCVVIGKESHRNMSKWDKHSPSNCRHKQKLLEAELAGMDHSSSSASVLELYREAIEGAKCEGFVQHEALACKRASEYIEQTNDSMSAVEHRCRAWSLYL